METVKLVSDLKINTNNPRRISEFMLGKLMESILVFPSMLSVRPVVVNKDNVVLGGNQRVEALIRMSGYSIQKLENLMLEQVKYRLMDDNEQNKLLAYWAEWLQAPTVSVICFDGSDKDQDEFMVKDNLQYGEDDYEKMKAIYDYDMVANMLGDAPQGLLTFDDRINDTEVDIDPIKVNKLKVGKVLSILTDEEYEWLIEKYSEFIKGSMDKGFVKYLLNE